MRLCFRISAEQIFSLRGSFSNEKARVYTSGKSLHLESEYHSETPNYDKIAPGVLTLALSVSFHL